MQSVMLVSVEDFFFDFLPFFPFCPFGLSTTVCPCPVILLEFKTSLSEFLIVSSASLFATVFATVILSLHSSCADWLRVSISGFVLSYEKFAK